MGKNAVVIGAGFGGLSAAALLAKDGFNVTVLEKNEQAGGRARVWKKDGFVFDMGPSWYLMPEVFENFFSLFGKKAADHYKLLRLDPNYRVFFGLNEKRDIPADRRKIEQLFDQMEKGGGEKLRRYMAASSYQYKVAMGEFMYRDYNTLLDLFKWRLISQGLKLHIFENLDRFARRYFKDERLRKILEYTVVFLGGSPTNTPALYSIMSHVDFELGVWYPCGGIGEVVNGFQRLAEEQGAQILCQHAVRRVEVADNEVKMVITEKGVFPADVVVVNADYQYAEDEMLEPRYRNYSGGYWEKKKIGPSAFIVYLGIDKKLPGLLHHNLYLDPAWDEHFRQIFDAPDWPSSPSYYISCPSKTDPTVAPAGMENIFILVPVAPGLEDNDAVRDQYYQKIISHLEQLAGEEIRPHIKVKRIYAHRDFISDYHAFKGTALGMAHTLFQTAVFRPSHRNKRLGNLYYTGNYTHPGIGVPMVVISSQVVRDLIRREHG